MRFRVLTLLSMLALAANPVRGAPVRSVENPSDVFAPGPKTAGAQDAWSLFHNPAGIAYVDGAQLMGGYAYQFRADQEGFHLGQGSLAVSLFEGLSLGLGLQLGLPQVQRGDDKGTIGGSFGLAFRLGRTMSFGARAFKQRQYALPEADPLAFSLGVEFFPFSWLSFGANFNQVYEEFASYPEIHAGVAVRPFTNKVTLGLESKFWPRAIGPNPDYSFHPELGLRVDLGAVSLLVSARVNDIGNGFSSPLLFAGIDFNFDHVGVGAVAQGRPSDLLSIGSRFRLSSERWPSLTQKKNRLVALELDEEGAIVNLDMPLARKLFGPGASPVETLWFLEQIAQDDSVPELSFKFPRFSFRFARAEELRNALTKLKASGKKIRVHFDTANAQTYLAASGADKINMSPAGEIAFDGFRNNLIYLHDTLKKLGIEAEAVTAGKYKNAPDMFTKSKPSKEELEVRNDILDHNLSTFAQTLPSPGLIDYGMLTATEAKEFGLVHHVGYNDDEEAFNTRVTTSHRNPHDWSESPRIAVISIRGMIVQGKVTPSLFGGFQRRTGAQDTIDALQAAIADRHCVAIVLRIDSPGGDALASNLVFHAVQKAKEHKPIIASFGDIAASGAYYIASAANSIFVEPTTLTGSIGVFSLVTSGQALSEKLDVKYFELKKSKNPGPSLFRPMTDSERKRYQFVVDAEYNLFKNNVAYERHFSPEQMESIAQGRVWTGTEALKIGIADEAGGFSEAVLKACSLARLDESSQIKLVLLGEPSSSLFSLSLFGNSLAPLEAIMPVANAPMALSTFSYDFPSALKETL